MTTSARIQQEIIAALSGGERKSLKEIKLTLYKNGLDDFTEGQFSGSVRTLLRNGSIRKADRGVYFIAKTKRGENKMKTCFIVSPIGDEGSDVRKRADQLYRFILTPVCEKCGFDPVRVDQINDADSITQTIIEKLNTAELVVADITGHNPNVFYEMGYRACTRKPLIHLKEKSESLPFDINNIRAFEYDLSDLESVEEIKGRLERTFASFHFEESPQGEDASEEGPGDGVLSKLFPVLYQIQDSIHILSDNIKKKDTETIQAIIQASLDKAVREESADTVLMKTLLPELMKNPGAFKNLLELSNMAEMEAKKR